MDGTNMRRANHKILAIVTSRNEPSHPPGTYTRLLAGRPLVAYSIMTARACRLVGRVCVASNDADVLAVAQSWGAETMIPPETTGAARVSQFSEVQHVLQFMQRVGYNATHVALFNATRPLRRVAEIDRAIDEYLASRADSALAVNELRLKAGKRGPDGWYTPQRPSSESSHDLQPLYQDNSAFYITRADLVAQGVLLGPNSLMLQLSPEAGVGSADAEFDFQMAEALFHQLKYENEFRRLRPVRAA